MSGNPQSEPIASEKTQKKRSMAVWVYIVFALIFIALLARTTLKMLRDTPDRDASVDLPGLGQVNVQFSTDPNPPLPTGTVLLSFMPSDNQNRMVDLGGSIPFSYGSVGSDAPVGSGQAVPDSTGMYYQAGVQFPTVGDYWVVLDLGAGKQVRYQVYVEPAQ